MAKLMMRRAVRTIFLRLATAEKEIRRADIANAPPAMARAQFHKRLALRLGNFQVYNGWNEQFQLGGVLL
jgi:hypothetical protein